MRFTGLRDTGERILFRMDGMIPPNLLATGNRLQRAYYRWALPHYERIGRNDPEVRAEVEAIDQLLYTRRGVWAWSAWLLGLLAAVGGLHRAGVGWLASSGIGALLWLGLTFLILGAWLGPAAGPPTAAGARPRPMLQRVVSGMVLGVAGALVGVLAGHWARHGSIDWSRIYDLAERAALTVLLLGLGLTLLISAVAWAGRVARAQRFQRLQLMAERDAARALASESELRLLQAQIHPHFVFNTLATLQHWVDKADGRAGPLLQELTGFLRRSTEMLGRPLVPLSEEAQAVSHYLAILRARMGDRLEASIDIHAWCAEQALPPGLLLTLVENAIEHGLEPKIGGGTLHIHARREANAWTLQVEDSGVGLAEDAADDVGLANLRQRLQQHYGRRARFRLFPRHHGGTCAEIRFEDAP